MRAGREAERETFLARVLKDALDDAVTDWADVSDVRWYLPDLEDGEDEPAPHGGANIHATLTGFEFPTPATHVEVSPQTVARGYDVLMKEGPHELVPQRMVERLLRARADNDPGVLMEDGLDQDALVQLGLFGKVIF